MTHHIYTHADWQNIVVAATARLGEAMGNDGLSAWLLARTYEAEPSEESERSHARISRGRAGHRTASIHRPRSKQSLQNSLNTITYSDA